MPDKSPTPCDILITGAQVLDGTGAPATRADIAIEGDVIMAVGDCSDYAGARVIDAAGLVAAPGFIDVHTHDDWAVMRTPDMPFKITQGVTTVVAGNCGISAAPAVARADLPPPFTVVPGAADYDFPTVADYAQSVAEAAPAVNVQLLSGHSSLRAFAMDGPLDRAATPDEVERMANALDHALSEGAAGLSSGLDYPAAADAPFDEMVTLARVVASHKNAVYTTHIRDEGDGVIDAVQEALDTATTAMSPLVISHHKCTGTPNFGKSVTTLKMIDEARKLQDLAIDVYPYNASSTALIPRFVRSARKVLVIWSTPHPEQAGRYLAEIATDWGVTEAQAVDRLMPAGAIYFDMDEADVQRIMQNDTAMIASDGLPGTDKPHPRLWGTFPRVLGRYVRELGLLTLAQAVHKMTGKCADRFGMTDRGKLMAGKKADIVLFDPDTVIDRANFDNPALPAAGIAHVLVNGQSALANGQQTGTRAGQFLKQARIA